MSTQTVKRYSDEELAVFKELINRKLEEAHQQMSFMENQLKEVHENQDEGFDLDEDSVVGYDLEMLERMVDRQRKYIRELDSAMIRVKQKTYGICEVTGTLIDKKRLMAVPITSKSLLAKTATEPKKIVPKVKLEDASSLDEKPVAKKIDVKNNLEPIKPKSFKTAPANDDFDDFEEEEEDWIFVEFDETSFESDGFDDDQED